MTSYLLKTKNPYKSSGEALTGSSAFFRDFLFRANLLQQRTGCRASVVAGHRVGAVALLECLFYYRVYLRTREFRQPFRHTAGLIHRGNAFHKGAGTGAFIGVAADAANLRHAGQAGRTDGQIVLHDMGQQNRIGQAVGHPIPPMLWAKA